MENTDDKAGLLGSLLEKAEAYGKTSFELYKLKAVDKAAAALSSVVSSAIALLTLFLFLAMAGTGIALWLGVLLGRMYYGFFCVAGFYALAGIILYLVKDNWIKRSVNNAIIRQALN